MANLAEINAAIVLLSTSDVDTAAEIQAIVDNINASNVIESYAGDNTNTAPTAIDYMTAGITGVTTTNLTEINAAIDLLTTTEADTTA